MSSRRRVRRAAWLAVLALAAWGAAPAAAETPLELAQGSEPTAVTDAAGTLHVVFRQYQSPARLLSCHVPAGGGPCAPVQIGHDAGTPYLLLRPQDGVLIAVFPSLDPGLAQVTSMASSSDGGATWTGQVPVGVGMHDISDAQLSPDGAYVDTVYFDSQNVLFQRVPLGGAPERRIVALGTKRDVRVPHVTHLPDGRPAVIAHFANGRLGVRVPAVGADPNDQSRWGSFTSLHGLKDADAGDGDGGPTGTWLLATSERRTRAGSLPVNVWRWGAHGFQDPRTIGALARASSQGIGAAADTNSVSLDVDLAGRLHAVWPLGTKACAGQHCFAYRRTDRRGFGPQIIYPLGPAIGDNPQRFEVAANSGGSGWLVWQDLSTRVRAVALVTPPLGSRVGSRRLGTRRVSIPDFYGCVKPGAAFVHRVKLDGRRGTRIVSVRFFFDAGQPARVDHRAPWRLTFRLGFPAGSRHVAGAIVSYRLPGERRLRSARIGRTFVMC